MTPYRRVRPPVDWTALLEGFTWIVVTAAVVYGIVQAVLVVRRGTAP